MKRLLHLTLMVYGLGLMLVVGWHWVRATDEPIVGWTYFIGNQPNGVYRLRGDGSLQTQLVPFGRSYSAPRLSADGQWLYFDAYRDRNIDIYRVRLDGSQLENITEIGWDDLYLFEHNGWIFFEVNSGAHTDIYRMRPDGSERQNITPALGGNNPVLSIDGEWIFFSYLSNLYRMRPDGSERQKLTQSLDGYLPFTDGQWLYFVSDQDGNQDIYRMRPDGSDPQNMTQTPHPEQIFAISADRQWLFYLYEYFDIYRMRTDGSQKEKITQSSFTFSGTPHLSADGQWIFFEADMNAQTYAYQMRSDGSQLKRLATYSRLGDSIALPPISAYRAQLMTIGAVLLLGAIVLHRWRK